MPIYTIELDGKQYDIEGSRPPTEAEARQAVQSFAPPEPPAAPPTPSAGERFVGGLKQGAYDATIGAALHPIDTLKSVVESQPGVALVRNVMQAAQGQQPEALTMGRAAFTPEGAGQIAGTAAAGYLTGRMIPKVPGGMVKAGEGLQAVGKAARPMTPWAMGEALLRGDPAGAALGVAPYATELAGKAMTAAGKKMGGGPAPIKGRLVKPQGGSDALAQMLNEMRQPEAPQSVSLPPTDTAMPKSGWVIDATGKRVYASDVEAARTRIGADKAAIQGKARAPKAAAPVSSSQPAPTGSPVEQMLRAALAERQGKAQPEMPGFRKTKSSFTNSERADVAGLEGQLSSNDVDVLLQALDQPNANLETVAKALEQGRSSRHAMYSELGDQGAQMRQLRSALEEYMRQRSTN